MLFLQLLLLPVQNRFQLAFHAYSIYVCICQAAIYHRKMVQKPLLFLNPYKHVFLQPMLWTMHC